MKEIDLIILWILRIIFGIITAISISLIIMDYVSLGYLQPQTWRALHVTGVVVVIIFICIMFNRRNIKLKEFPPEKILHEHTGM